MISKTPWKIEFFYSLKRMSALQSNSAVQSKLDEIDQHNYNTYIDNQRNNYQCVEFKSSASLMLMNKLVLNEITRQLDEQNFDSNYDETALFVNQLCIKEYFPYLSLYINNNTARAIYQNSTVTQYPTELSSEQPPYLVIKLKKELAELVLSTYEWIIQRQTENQMDRLKELGIRQKIPTDQQVREQMEYLDMREALNEAVKQIDWDKLKKEHEEQAKGSSEEQAKGSPED